MDTLNPYADEALRRFRLDLVDIEQETVAEQPASIDRVRECFRALVRSLEISDDDGDDEEEDYFSAPPPYTQYGLSRSQCRHGPYARRI